MSKDTRRSFIEKLAASSVALTWPSITAARSTRTLSRSRKHRSANDKIQLGLIGAGGMGVIDATTALEIPDVALMTVCDLYDGRLVTSEATEEWPWADLTTTRDYREVIGRDDIDAVIVATPDHWHRKISIDAMRAGKSVYCEKPMVHKIGEGAEVVRVQQETQRTFQVGSQGMSSLGNEKARELYLSGAIGELNYAEGFWARNSPTGAWQYDIPDDASEDTVGWGQFLGDAPEMAFDPIRFFRWRNYFDYGTGVSGDLFVHLFSSLHFIIGSKGPNKVMATGGLRYWKDGRDAPDVVLGMFDYEASETHPPFNLSLRCNFVDGTSGSTFLRLVGHEGSMDVTWTDVTLRKNKVSGAMDTFNARRANEDQADFGERKQMLPPAESVYRTEEGYWGAHIDHFLNWFDSIREGRPAIEDAVFGFRAAAPALACNQSLAEGRAVHWDPENMRLIDERLPRRG